MVDAVHVDQRAGFVGQPREPGMSGRVPSTLEAAVTATSLVRSESTAVRHSGPSSAVWGSKSIHRTIAPAASAACTHGRTLASWSRRETTTSSPGRQVRASARDRS